jgi:hypothetical protein
MNHEIEDDCRGMPWTIVIQKYRIVLFNGSVMYADTSGLIAV